MELEGKRILLVEDDEFLGDLVVHHLTEAGATYEWGKDGEEGFKKLSEGKFDFIISDLSMPGMSGLDMITKIKESEELKQVPILVLTNLTNDDLDVQKASQLGVNGFFAKSSTSMNELVVQIASIIKN